MVAQGLVAPENLPALRRHNCSRLYVIRRYPELARLGRECARQRGELQFRLLNGFAGSCREQAA